MTSILEVQAAANDPYLTFMRLFTRHEGALRCFVRTLLPTWDDVDEVMQDVSIAAWWMAAYLIQSRKRAN